MFTSSAAQQGESSKQKKSAFTSWFAASLEEEFEPSVSNYLFPEESTTGTPNRRRASSGSFKRRNSESDRRKQSPIGLAQSNKPRMRTTPLKRTNSNEDKPEPRGRLLRMSAKNDTTEVANGTSFNKSNRSNRSSNSQGNDQGFDGLSAQSSITNSWAPKMRLHHPAPYQPHKPLENMIITVRSNVPEEEADDAAPLKEESLTKGDDSSTAISSSHSALPGESFRRKGEMLYGVQEIDAIDEHDESNNKDCMQSLALTEEQKAEADEFVFKGWGALSDVDGGDDGDDDECLLQGATNFKSSSSNDQGAAGATNKEKKQKSNKSWFFKRKDGSLAQTNSSAGDSIPDKATEPQTIEEAMRELQELTGMQVKCLDESTRFLVKDKEDMVEDAKANGEGLHERLDEGDNDIEENELKTTSQHEAVSPNVDEAANGDKDKQMDKNNKAGWFFPGKGRKIEPAEPALINENDELAQPYALIRSAEDEARLKKHFEEEERIKTEDEKRRLEFEENKKKKGSWFFFKKEDEEGRSEESVLDDDKIADALDDLELFAGEERVSQVKEARILEKVGGDNSKIREIGDSDHRETPNTARKKFGRNTSHMSAGVKEGETELTPLQSPNNEISPGFTALRERMSGKQKKTLSRFELPLVADDEDSPPAVKQLSEQRSKSLNVIAGGSGRNLTGGNARKFPGGNTNNLSDSLSSLGKLRNLKGDTEVGDELSITEEEFLKKDQHADDDSSQIDESIPPPPKVSDVKKEALIVDSAKRDARWRLNQTLVNHLFRSYHSAMSNIDGLLPSEDEFDVFAGAEESVEQQFQEVRNKMLEDGNFSEREVASFFEGFALLTVKSNALQSQLDALKAVNRAEKEERNLQHLGPQDLLKEDLTKDVQRILLIKNMAADSEITSETKALLRQLEVNERKRVKLEKELLEQGVVFSAPVPFDEVKGQVERMTKRMEEINATDNRRLTKRRQAEQEEELEKLESDTKKCSPILSSYDAWAKREDEWEAEHAEENLDALQRIRRHLPVLVKVLNENQMSSEKTPNGKLLPKRLAKKFCETNTIQLLRTHPDDIDLMHPSILENLRMGGLTLSERRALYAHLKELGPRWRSSTDDETVNRKWLWFRMFKQEFKEALDVYRRHCEDFGPPDNHPYATRANPTAGCPFIGKQCPIKADKMFDYAIDYGFPEGDVYEDIEKASVKKQSKDRDANEAEERLLLKKAIRRSEKLKHHYSGKVLQVALANGSCEAMDKIMDRMDNLQSIWIEDRIKSEKNKRITDERRRIEMGSFTAAVRELKLALPPFAERSGMQLTGNKEANARQPDDRSPVELGLCEEVWEHADDFFAGIEYRIKQLGVKDSEIKTEIEQLRELIDELHNRNMTTLNDLGVRYPEPSRKLIKRKEIEKTVRANLDLEESDQPAEAGINQPMIGPNLTDLEQSTATILIPEPWVEKATHDESLQTTIDLSQNSRQSLARSSRRNSTSSNVRGRTKRPNTRRHSNDVGSIRSQSRNEPLLTDIANTSTLSTGRLVVLQKVERKETEIVVSSHAEEVKDAGKGETATSGSSSDPSPVASTITSGDGPSPATSTGGDSPTPALPSSVADDGPNSTESVTGSVAASVAASAVGSATGSIIGSVVGSVSSSVNGSRRSSIAGSASVMSERGGDDTVSVASSRRSSVGMKVTARPMKALVEGAQVLAEISPLESIAASATSRDSKLTKTRAALDALRARNSSRSRATGALRESSKSETEPTSKVDPANGPASQFSIDISPRDTATKSAILREKLAATRNAVREGSATIRGRIAAGKSPGRERFGKSPGRIAAGKSPARERIAELRGRLSVKSPGRERLAEIARDGATGGGGADAAERLAAIEARREKMRASIAARKKAREEAANATEIKP